MRRPVLVVCLVLWSPIAALADAQQDWSWGFDAQQRGDTVAAMRLYTKAIQSGELSGETLAKVHVNRAAIYVAGGQLDAAIADYDAAIRAKPDFAFAFTGRCSAHIREQLYDQAIADCDRAVALEPGYLVAYFNRGIALYYKNQIDRAAADFTKAIEIDPNYALAYSFRCHIYVVEAERESERDPMLNRASADCAKALNLSPGEPSATQSQARIATLRHAGAATAPGGGSR
jgi:tetratricopeptide (TPR) repeat protein